ncbi:MAG TPA: hypothetical protein VFE17_03865 [Candidatus Baltobacteraceae bacterium]|jgi:hypothetical protein|nr:hypothetical protein [Candidatus Baltobacteraceae bacterium]
MTDLERALADIAEVRERLGHAQRFRGYSGIAAMTSGVFAVAGGVVQALLVPTVSTVHQGHLYVALWLVCCAAAVLVNYGAIAHWYVNDATARDRWQTATVGYSILPALVLGATLSIALLRLNLYTLLPAVWYGCYGVGLFASRTTLPRPVVLIASGFLLAGIGLLFVPAFIALSWWVLPLGFGLGQILIGCAIIGERNIL